MLTKRLLPAILTLLLIVGLPLQVNAAEITCPEGQMRVGNRCVIAIDPPSNDPRPPGGGNPGVAPKVCRRDGGAVVPCTSEMGVWSNARLCYLQLLAPQPPLSNPWWGGHTPDEGAIYDCTTIDRMMPGYYVFIPNGGEEVDVRAIAERLRAEMPVNPVEIGIVPEPGPESVGLVGLPTWMWVADPGPTTWGPQSRSLTVGGITVTLQARVETIRWSMGDGAVVSCSSPGTPYEDRFGSADSPTCGHRYTKQGTYPVTATAYWTAEWSATTGESGSFAWQMVSETSINVGEAQALNQ